LKFGLAMFPTDESIPPDELARATEERGFESLFFPEHTHIPVSRRSPFPSGGELPRRYIRCLDLFVACTAAALASERLLVGSGICLVIQRDPIVTAKETASVDWLSGGRFLFGVGAGWNLEEMESHGTDPDRRFGVMRERVEAIRTIWTENEAEYHGRYVDFDPIWSWPKPAQRPHPPVLVGGNGPKVLDRVLAYGDGWFPNRTPNLEARVAELRRRAQEAGREPLPVTFYGMPPERELIERYREAGVARCVFWLPSAPADEAIAAADRFAELVGSVG
jgi:probable F420-dependent oxidoreductase